MTYSYIQVMYSMHNNVSTVPAGIFKEQTL